MITNILIFSPHPDDAELCIGGFIISHLEKYGITIANLTNGEKSSNGSFGRMEESIEIENNYQNLKYIFMNIPDMEINSFSNLQRNKIVKLIRELRPSIIINIYNHDYHQDHNQASNLVDIAVGFAGIREYNKELGNPHNVKYVLKYSQKYIHKEEDKTIFFDVSNVYEHKMQMLMSYRSQLYLDENNNKTTLNMHMINKIRKKDQYLGSLINSDFAEQLILEKGEILVDNIFKILS